MRRLWPRAVPALGVALALGCGGLRGAVPFPGDVRRIDLSHPFDASTIYWPTDERGFELQVLAAGVTPGGYYYAANRVCSAEHGGTHLDAPIHFAEGRATADRVPLDRLIAPAVVVDVSGAVAQDRDHLVTIADLERFEAAHGRIEPGTIVLLHTGYARLWPDRLRYLGTARRGAEAAAELHFPGLHPDAARWLVRERRIASVGIDTASIDHGPSRSFETHRVLSEAEVPAFENLAALEQLPPRGFWIVALPMKIGGGSGGPLRAVALVPRRGE
jgi:kynurenine formamidase